MSKKRRAILPARKACCEAVNRRSNGRCEVGLPGCLGEHHHTHEVNPRSAGGSITDPGNCVAICNSCHDQIHQSPNKARQLGLLAPR